jgi:lipopolysaccharide transport system permease protein
MVYPITMVPEAYRQYFELNPLYALIQSWRSVFLQSALDAGHMAYAAACAVVMGAVAWMLYRRLAPRISELI